MTANTIQNLNDLIKFPDRKDIFSIIEAGFDAIKTEEVINSAVSVNGDVLSIKDHKIDLKKYKNIRVVGFGKASCEAAIALEKVLGSRIKDGVVLDIKTTQCEFITVFAGTHPRPSIKNTIATKHILDLAKDVTEDDLVLVVVSGGGSALLCGTEEECNQGDKLYDEFIKIGGSIDELNLVRKHISFLKGGGLAKILYPATIVGLIFCDVPGDSFSEVASGPTYKDKTTVQDAQAILKKYGLADFELNETPKEDKYFEKVSNIPLVSNGDALNAMANFAQGLGYATKILSTEIYDSPEQTLRNFRKELDETSVGGQKSLVLGGGEVKLNVKGKGGIGGRCTHLALEALDYVASDEFFVAVASDGIDNSDAAGAIADKITLQKAKDQKIDDHKYLSDFDSFNFFKKTGDLILTGQTGANVSDLMLWMKK